MFSLVSLENLVKNLPKINLSIFLKNLVKK